MAFCLIKPLADKFKMALREGKINPQELADMSSDERRTLFEQYVGEENATQVNALFESKLLLKDVQRGMIQWAKEITGIKPETRKGMIARIERLDTRILNPENQEAFLQDLASRRLGVEVTLEEAKEVARLSKNLAEARAKLPNDRLAYGVARVQLETFMREKKQEANKVTFKDFKANPIGTTVEAAGKIGGIAKSLKATLDVSAIGRQGFKTIFTHPKQWAINTALTFKNIFTTLSHKTSEDVVMDALRAEIYSRENSTNGLYDKMKLDIGTGEEAYPSSLPEKIPGLGRIFKASEVAYSGFLTRLRADIADQYIEVAKANGIDVNDKFQAESIGSLVNSLTGRGNKGVFGRLGEPVNSLFFSPKNFQANVDFLLMHPTEKMSLFARKQAAINLFKVVGGVFAILAIAKSLWPEGVENDPRSSNFGKIRIGDTRFDVTGGEGSLITLLARIATGSTKSSVTGQVSELGNKFGQQSRLDTFLSFAGNKISPVAGLAKNLLKGVDSENQPLTVKGELTNLLMPLPITNAINTLQNPKSAPAALVILADALGFATNTYSDQTTIGQIFSDKDEVGKKLHDLANSTGKYVKFTDWETSTTSDLQDFRKQIGEDQWKTAKERYQFQVKERVDEALKSEAYKNWTDEDKVRYLNTIDTDAKNKVFSQFNYKRPKLPKKKPLKL